MDHVKFVEDNLKKVWSDMFCLDRDIKSTWVLQILRFFEFIPFNVLRFKEEVENGIIMMS